MTTIRNSWDSALHPVTGYRIMVDPDFDEKAIVTAILDGMRSYRDHAGLSSHSLLFVEPEWESLLDVAEDSSPGTSGFLRWAHQYFLWENDGYRSFDDYLSRFSKNQRRNIRRERTSVRTRVSVSRH
jgi:predicted N-acyltransferase